MASVQSQNLFSLLEDDVTEVNTVKAPPKAAPAAAPVKKEAPKPAAPAKKDDARPERSDSGAARGGRGGARGGGPRREGDSRPPRAPRVDGEGNPVEPRGERPPRTEGGDFRNADRAPRHAGGRGSGAPRREGRERSDRHEYTTKGEREHDRRSRGPPGSDDKNEEKKGGRGKHNWGDPVAAEEGAPEGAAEVPDVVSTPREPTEEEIAAQKEREEEEKQMTLEEYRKKQAAEVKKPEVQLRAANEGADDSQWKNAVPIKKKDEDVDPFLLGMKAAKTGKKKTAKAADGAQPELALEFKFNDDNQGARGDDRGGRGGRGRGGDRRPSDRGNAPRRNAPRSGPAPAINDESAFPSLG